MGSGASDELCPLLARSWVIRIHDNFDNVPALSIDRYKAVFRHFLHHDHRMRGGYHPARGNQGTVTFHGQVGQSRKRLRRNAVAGIVDVMADNDGVCRQYGKEEQ
jgi:hypothetical protein